MYPGGKNACYQQIINLIPPHQTYIEPFLGSGAVMRNKRPAMINIGIDLDSAVLSQTASWHHQHRRCTRTSPASASAAALATADDAAVPSTMTRPPGTDLDPIASFNDVGQNRYYFYNTDAIRFLQSYDFAGDTFIYLDPPYLLTTRSSKRPIYDHEFYTDDEHRQLLTLLLTLPCSIMISGYRNELYDQMLSGWPTHHYNSTTRGGRTAVEYLYMNYPQPIRLHDYQYLGANFRERERIKRKAARWVKRFAALPTLEKQAIIGELQRADALD